MHGHAHMHVQTQAKSTVHNAIYAHAGQIYEGPSFIQLNTIAKCMDDEFKNK